MKPPMVEIRGRTLIISIWLLSGVKCSWTYHNVNVTQGEAKEKP